MKKFILTFAITIVALCGFSQDKGTTQLSALYVSSSDVSINASSPSITHYFIDNMGLTLGIANFEDISLGARYYIKNNNFAYAGYGTGSESLDLGLGKTFGWGDHIQLEPRLNFTDIISDDRNLNLSIHLNFAF
jgi:hypothetical protein